MSTEPMTVAVGFQSDRYGTFVKDPDLKSPSARLLEIEKVHAGMVEQGKQTGNKALSARARKLQCLARGLRQIQLTREAKGTVSEADAAMWEVWMSEYERLTGVRPVEVT